jgi:hypothetical protein
LRKYLTKPTREVVVILLDVPPDIRNECLENAFELVRFLELACFISERDVTPLLKIVRRSNSLSLISISIILERYQIEKDCTFSKMKNSFFRG